MEEKDFEKIEQILLRHLKAFGEGFDRKQDQQSEAFDSKLEQQTKAFDRKLEQQTKAFDRILDQQVDKLSGDVDQKLRKQSGAFSDELDCKLQLQTEDFDQKLQRHIGIISEDFQHKLELVIEGQQSLAEKLDATRDELKADIAKVDNRLTTVAADLSVHRANTEAHGHQAYYVREE